MKVACSPEAWPPRRPPAPSTTSKVCSPEETWPLRRPPAPPAPNRRVWGAIGAIVLLQTATIAAVLAPRPETDARRRLLDEEMIEPPLLKVREDHDLGEVDERRRLSGALWGLKTVTTATTLTKFMGTMVLCDTSSAAITVTLPAASDMAEQSGASLRHYKFINTGSNDCTIARAGSDTIVTSTLTATFSGGATTSTFTGTAFTPAGTVSQPTFTGTQVTPQGTIQTDTPGGTVAIVNAATASTGLTAITLKPGSSLALVGDGTSAWYQYGGTSIAVA